MSTSEKALKEQIIAFIDNIKHDLKAIESLPEEEMRMPILVEYKQSLNLNKSIEIAYDRKSKLEEELRLQKEKEEEKAQENTKSTAEVLEQKEEIKSPTNLTQQEKIYTLTFKVSGTMQELKKLKEYIKNSKLEVK